MRKMKRREFMAGSAATAAVAGACACGLGGCATFTGVGKTPAIPAGSYMIERGKVKIVLDKAPELAKAGGSVKIDDPNLPEPLIVAHAPDGSYVAVGLKCTHRGVELEYQPKANIFRCASLGRSAFRPAGTRIKGPAKKPLKSCDARLALLDKNKLVIQLPGG
ncbi:MAG TPA: Rieske 2Fe-2S domain-containing protein [bacterium]|nr:Rieske 2Fe-2S domain-containing protein [bacterium]